MSAKTLRSARWIAQEALATMKSIPYIAAILLGAITVVATLNALLGLTESVRVEQAVNLVVAMMGICLIFTRQLRALLRKIQSKRKT